MVERGTVTFSSSEPFAHVLDSIRSVLRTEGLRVIAEIDVARRIRRTLGISLPSCRILYVWPGTELVESVFPATAVFLPLHVVVAAQGPRTDVSLLRHVETEPNDVDDFVSGAVARTQAGLFRSIERISMRVSLA